MEGRRKRDQVGVSSPTREVICLLRLCEPSRKHAQHRKDEKKTDNT